MNKNIIRSLAVGAVLLILLVVLYRFFIGSPPPTGPSPVTAPAPPSPLRLLQPPRNRLLLRSLNRRFPPKVRLPVRS